MISVTWKDLETGKTYNKITNSTLEVARLMASVELYDNIAPLYWTWSDETEYRGVMEARNNRPFRPNMPPVV